MNDRPRLSVDVVSDVVCPWCYVGLKRLERAMVDAQDIAVEVRWRPFQLDPSIPEGGVDRKQYMMAKFGSEERLREIAARLAQTGIGEGIDFKFDAIKVSPNTLDAHRVIRWAASATPGTQHFIAERLFRAYFEQGRDVGSREVLIDTAREAGMDAALVETLLASGADRDEVRTEIQTAQRMGVTGVPCYLLDGRYAVMGAQDSTALADAFRKVVQARDEAPPQAH